MTIDWNHFTPWASLAGGVLLGLASALFIMLNGRILGISGILAGLLPFKRADSLWRLSFLAGLFAAPWLVQALAPGDWLATPRIEASTGLVLVSGVLVGLGTRFGAGCTSGHGVCGLSRMSPRSIVATGLFMAAGFATVFVVQHVLQ
jgi:uncharacterized membrane protein YedE/YeeE